MITNRKFTVTFAICFLLYLLPEIFVNNALLYLSGGAIGGTIKEILKTDSNVLIFSIWLALNFALVFGYFQLKSKLIKYLLLLVIGFTLNIIDNLFAFVPIFDIGNKGQAIAVSYVVMLIEILLKSLSLSWIYYKGDKRK